MKILQKSEIYRLALLFVMGVLVISCSKDKVDDSQPTFEGDAAVSMSVFVPNDDIKLASFAKLGSISGAGKASSGSRAAQAADDTEGFVSYDNFEARTKFYAPQQNDAAKAELASGSNVNVAKAPLTKKYRVLMYKQAATTPAVNVVVTPGVDPLIKVDAGVSYKLVVFSINEDAVPNIGAGNTIAAADITNKDVLYYTTTLTTVFGNNDIDVVLKRKTTRIALGLDVRGLFGGVERTSKIEIGYGTGATFNTVLKTASFDLFNESFGAATDVAALTADKFKFDTLVTSAYGLLDGVMNFYTVGTTTVPAGQFKVRLGTLDIWADRIQTADGPPPVFQNVIKNYTNTLTFPTANSGNPGFTTTPGTVFKASLELLVPKIIVNGLVIAPANLAYEPTVSSAFPYRFKADNQMDPYSVSAQSTFWNWRSLTPTGTPNAGDPCALVFPANTWRMPTQVEFQGIIDQFTTGFFFPSNNYDTSIGLLAGADIRYVLNRGTANRSDFRMYGYRNTDGTTYAGKPLAAVIGLIGGFGSANYWTSTLNGATEAKYFEGKYEGLLGILPSVKKPEIKNSPRNYGYNIRCVRPNT